MHLLDAASTIRVASVDNVGACPYPSFPAGFSSAIPTASALHLPRWHAARVRRPGRRRAQPSGWVRSTAASRPPVTHDRDRGVQAYAFCHDDQRLVYLQDTDGNESWRVYALDLHTGDTDCSPRTRTSRRAFSATTAGTPTMLIGLNADNPQLHDVYRLDISTGEMEKIEDNPASPTGLSTVTCRYAAEPPSRMPTAASRC